jgi:hypothetical protein
MDEKYFYAVDFGEKNVRKTVIGSIPLILCDSSPNRREITPEWMQPQFDLKPGESYHRFRVGTGCEGVYFFGLINSNDIACGSWSTPTGDFCQDLFVGDAIGEIRVRYSDETETVIPLVVGFTSWFYSPWSVYGSPFGDDETAKQDLDHSLYVSDIWDKKEKGYLLAFKPAKKSIDYLEIIGNPTKSGFPTLYGISLCNPKAVDHLIKLGEGETTRLKFLDEDILQDQETIERRLKKVIRHLYTCEDELPEYHEIEHAVPEGYEGPVLRMDGNRVARMRANQYMNILGISILEGEEGSCKAVGAYGGGPDWQFRYKHCMGIYQDKFPAGGTFWTRDLARIYIERMKAGDVEAARRGLDFYAKVLYASGTFTPGPLPHWVQNYNAHPAPGQSGAFGFGLSLKTRTTGEQIIGNLENDGHGLILLAMRQYYTSSGLDRNWLIENHQVIEDAADWFCYLIDHPIDVESMFGKHASFYNDIQRTQQPGILWSENESANYGACDTWNNAIAYYALIGAAELEEALGQKTAAVRYREYATGLLDSMDKYLTEEHPQYGKVWKYFHHSSWQDFNETLAPVICAYDIMGSALSTIDPTVLQTTRNTYRMLIHRGKDHEKYYYYTRAYGYGQAFITEAALLLDEIEDAEKLLETASKYMYCKREHPWLCAEGSIAHESGKYWYRHNGIGNEIQVASMIRVFRIMIGIDDTDPKRLLIAPRIPKNFMPASVERYPIISQSEGIVTRCFLRMNCRENEQEMEINIESDKILDHLILQWPVAESYDYKNSDIKVYECSRYNLKMVDRGHQRILVVEPLAPAQKIRVTVNKTTRKG